MCNTVLSQIDHEQESTEPFITVGRGVVLNYEIEQVCDLTTMYFGIFNPR